MWYSNVSPLDTTPWVIFDLGGLYSLATTRIWQFNQSPYGFTVYGAADVELSFSSTDTNSFTPLSLQTCFPTRAGATRLSPRRTSARLFHRARYVKLQIWTTFGGAQQPDSRKFGSFPMTVG